MISPEIDLEWLELERKKVKKYVQDVIVAHILPRPPVHPYVKGRDDLPKNDDEKTTEQG